MGLFSGPTENKYQSQIAELEQKHTAQIAEMENRFKSQLEILEKENTALKKSISEKSNAAQELSKKIDELEKQLSVYSETFATLKDIKASKEEEAYIAHQLRVLDLTRLVNASGKEKGIDMADRQRALDKRIQAQKELKEKVKRAIEAEEKTQKEDAEATASQFSYEVSSSEVTITGYLGIKENDILQIPEQIESYPITRIADHAFENMHMKKVQFPNTVEYIGKEAFRGCVALKEMELPSKLKGIGYGCFQSTALRSVVIPSGVKQLGMGCFLLCEQLDTVVMNEGLTQIDGFAFARTAIRKIVIPKSIKKIGKETFSYKPVQVAFLGTDEVNIEAGAFPANTTIYALPNSMVIQRARRLGMTVKPLDEFEL